MANAPQLPWEIDGDNEWLRYWEAAAPHRQTLADLITQAVPRGGEVCVWGAGSCHDLDLPKLRGHCGGLTLVDLNPQHLRWGVEYQLGEAESGVRMVGPVDLAGVRPVSGLSEDRTIRPRVLTDRLRMHEVDGLGRYDLVVSAGMLSQVIRSVVEAAGHAGAPDGLAAPPDAWREHELAGALVIARRRHLRLMADHLRPGGVGFVVVDLINSEDQPSIETAEDLRVVVETAGAADPERHVLAPENLQRDLLRYAPLAMRVSSVGTSGYWKWRMTERCYACYALRFSAAE